MLVRITPEIINAVKEIEDILINKEYKNLTSNGRTNRVSTEDVEKVLNDYGGTITERPLETVSGLEIIKVDESDFDEYHVDYDLYIGGKHSDLTLSLVVTDNNGNFTASIDDLHVM